MSEAVWQAGRRFTHKSALQPALHVAIGFIVGIDAVWVHFLVGSRAPLWVTLGIDLINAAVLLFLWFERRAMSRSAIAVDRDAVHLHTGWKYRFAVARERIVRAYKPTFRDVPRLLTPGFREFVDLTKPSAPNVILELSEPIAVKTMGIVEKSAVKRVALRVDDPAAFLEALGF